MSPGNRKRDCEVRKDAHAIILPAGAPDWITPQLVADTISVWQPYYDEVLTPEEAVTMILSVGRLYQAISSGSSP